MSSEPILLEEVKSKQNTWKLVKPHVFTIILVLLSVAVILFANFFSSDALPIVIFSLILLVPVLVIFKNNLPDVVPYPIRKLLNAELDKPKPSKEERKGFPKVTVYKKQQYLTIGMTFVSILLFVLIMKIRPELSISNTSVDVTKNKTFLKIMAALFLTCFLGVLLVNFQEYSKIPVAIKKDNN